MRSADGPMYAIQIPNSVQEIGNGTFYECSNLEEIVLPKALKRIGTQAFYNCALSANMLLPEGLEYIGTAALGTEKDLGNVVFTGFDETGQV